jgi:hypothetical protein
MRFKVVKAAAAPQRTWLAALLLACPLDPAPLAARGLAAVLARAIPTGGGYRHRIANVASCAAVSSERSVVVV